MSMTIDTPVSSSTLKERSAVATRHLCETLHLDALAPKDLTYLALALTEAATEEAERNSAFSKRVRELYEAVAPPQKAVKTRGATSIKRPSQAEILAPLKAVGAVDPARIAPYAPPDPYALMDLYGAEQLPRALYRFTLDSLKRAVPFVQAQHPGTRPASMAKKDAIVEYIMRYVTEPAEPQSQAV